MNVVVVPDAHRTISVVTRPAARQRPALAAMVGHLARAAQRYAFDEAAA